MALLVYVVVQFVVMLLIPIAPSSASSILWNSYPQLYEYFDTGEKDNEQPVYWEQYYSDIEDYNNENYDESSNEKFSRQLQENNVPESNNSRDKRMRQVTCEVIKQREHFSDPEYEFMPSTYVNTTCVENTECDPSFNDNSDRKQMCVIRSSRCRTNYKEMTVFKRRRNQLSWHIHKVQKVAVGCCDHN